MNTVSISGRLTKEPDVRYGAESQKAVARFTLAVDKNFKKKDDKANFINVVCFGKTAEFVEKFARKGKRVAVFNGELTTGSYKNKEGNTVYTTDVIAGQVEIIDWPEKDDDYKERKVADSFDELDEEVPF